MDIRVVKGDPLIYAGWPHYCGPNAEYIGLSVEGGDAAFRNYIFCPWCGQVVPPKASSHRYERAIRPESYDGPRCVHGYPDAPCVDVARIDSKTAVDLLSGLLREGRVALLADRYGCAPHVIDWVRPCPDCRLERAESKMPVLRHELETLAKAMANDMRAAEKRVDELRDAAHAIRDAMAELSEVDARLRESSVEPHGFIYLIGHHNAVKIGWSQKHPVAGGRLSGLQVGTPERLELIGLVVGPYTLEAELQGRFAAHRIRGEWFTRHEEILAYFEENGIAV